jgi:hypothetical protein
MADFEQLLFEVSECHVFKIPPRQSAAGHKAEDWQGHHIWTGICKVKAKGDIAEVRLEDSITGEPFAVCPVNTKDTSTKYVEPVTDSSRYFVLRIEDGKGHHAFIGMGFEERSHAFDFNVAISDFKSQVKRQAEVSQGSQIIVASNTDYSLKEGEKIRVDLKGKNKTETKGPSEFSKQMGISAPGAAPVIQPTAGFMPPPPGGKKAQFRNKQAGAGQAPPSAGQMAPSAPATSEKKDDLDSLLFS